MSISNAFVSSRSGLAANAARSEVTANNIANADRPGYARRGLLLTSGLNGTGVQVSGLRRDVDAALDRMHRQEMSRTAKQDTIGDGLKVHAALLGGTGDPLSLSGRITALQSRLGELANDPAQPSLQRAALDAAAGVAAKLNATSATLTETAENTHNGIAVDVAKLNRLLADTADLNARIALREPGTREMALLEDTLATRLDEMSELIDLRTQRGADGGITVYTAGGTPLVEGRMVHRVEFDRVAGKLTAGDAEITPGVARARGFEEGRIAGRIALLNDVLPRMQLQLDEAARMLVVSFTQADATVEPPQAGLFTDRDGRTFDTDSAGGLAARIMINTDVRGDKGDALWKMRDGVNASLGAPESDSTQINRMLGGFDVPYDLLEGVGLGASARLTDFIPAMIADQQVARTSAEGRADSLRAGAQALETARQSIQGVSIDDELQQLAAIEQGYAANAIMMRTLGEMLDTLLAAVR